MRLCFAAVIAATAVVIHGTCPEPSMLKAYHETLIAGKNCAEVQGFYPHNCTITLQCAGNYYFANQNFANGMTLTCNQNLWISPDGSVPINSENACVPGCHTYNYTTATLYNMNEPDIYKNQNATFYKHGTVIKTSCKAGFIFAQTYNRKDNRDYYLCDNGTWIDVQGDCEADGEEYHPGNCKGYCTPLNAKDLKNAEFALEPCDDEYITNNGKPYVIEDSLYEIKCKNGTNLDGCNNQQLICRNNNEYYDPSANKENAQILPCVNSLCQSYNNTDTHANIFPRANCVKNDDNEFGEGCELVAKCENGYFNPDPHYKDGQSLLCKNAAWIDTATQNKPSGNVCLPGCKVVDLGNATIVKSTNDQVYPYLNDKYVASGANYQTECKKGYAFVDPDNRQRKTDNYTCIGGADKPWQNQNNGGDNNGRPGMCLPTCTALSSSSGVNIVADPTKNNQSVLVDGANQIVYNGTYKFACADGFSPVSNSNPEQTLICNGDDKGYYNPSTQTYTKLPVVCVASGCPVLGASNIDPNSFIDKLQNCEKNGEFEKDGCQITIRCKAKTYYFNNPDNADGQTLTCQQGKWYNKDNSSVNPQNGIYSDQCTAGCAALTDKSMVNADYVRKPTGSYMVHKNGADEVWSDQALVTTKCKDGFGRQNPKDDPISQYICTNGEFENIQNNEKHEDPGACVPLCPLPVIQDGTKISNAIPDDAKTIIDGVSYVYPNTVVNITCDKKFELPNKKDYPDGTQQLVCVGGKDGYAKKGGNATNVIPQTCKKAGAEGCNPITAQSVPGANVTLSNCDIVNGLAPASCQVTIKCKDNYYAVNSDGSPASNNEQALSCNADSNKWKDLSANKLINNHINCLPGCPTDSVSNRADIVNQPDNQNIVKVDGKSYYKQGTIVNVTCKKEFVPKTQPERDPASIGYKCDGTSVTTPWINTITNNPENQPGATCSSVCNAIQSLPDNVEAVQSPQTFEHDNNLVFVEDDSYVFKCEKNYKYPAGSSPANSGKQQLVCKNGGTAYLDQNNIKTVTTPQACVRGTPAGCQNLGSKGVPEGVQAGSYDKCNLTNGLVVPGCKATIVCSSNFYPNNADYRDTGKQQLQCVDNGTASHWQDQNGNEVNTILDCNEGCESPDPLVNAEYAKNRPVPSITSGDKQFYLPGVDVTVKCKPGTLPSNMDSSYAQTPMTYTCKGLKGWKNNANGLNEPKPGSICQPVCDALSPLPEGVRTLASPGSLYLGDRNVIRDQSVYKFSCTSGYHYSKINPPKDNVQEVLCDKGILIDKETGTSITEPKNCLREAGIGCKDLPQINGKVVSEQCPTNVSSHGDGCQLQVACQPGFFPENSKYQPNGVQTLACKNNNWEDQFGNKILTGLECSPGCIVPDNSASNNFLVSATPKNVIHVGKDVYIKPNDVINIKCQNDGVVWQPDVSATSKPHQFTCQGGDQNYTRNDDNKNNVNAGDGCVGTCELPQLNLPDTVYISQTPSTFNYDNSNLAVANTQYVLQCNDEFEYSSKTPYYSSQKQNLVCNGKLRKFVDQADPNNGNVNITDCVPVKNANVCEDLSQNNTAANVKEVSCVKRSKYFMTPCKLEISCNPGFYPVNNDYQKQPGKQILTCQSSGRGWVDQLSNPVNSPLNCVPGCVKKSNPTSTDTIQKTVVNNYIIGDETISCQSENTQTVTKNLSNQTIDNAYYCPENKNEKDNSIVNRYVDKSCTNACAALIGPFPEGTISKYVGQKVKNNGRLYVPNNAEISFECDHGYIYPESSPYFKSGHQVLKCDGKTNKYVDSLSSDEKNVTIANCVKGATCENINQNTQTIQSKYLSCSKSSGKVLGNCVIENTCNKGYYPKDPEYLTPAKEVITCNTDGKGWVNQFGKVITKPMECVFGCIQSNTTVVLSHEITKNSTVNEDYMFVRDADGNIMSECLTIDKISYINSLIKKKQADDNKFYCNIDLKIENDNIDYYYNSYCKNTCRELKTPLPPNVVVEKKPVTFNYDDMTYVPQNQNYVLKCAPGFEYPDGSTAAPTGSQTLVCNGATNFYDDVVTGVKKASVLGCVPVSGCSPPTVSTPGTVVKFEGCTKKGAVYGDGCQISTTCKKGYYPVDKSLWPTEGQNLKCNLAVGSSFITSNGQPVTKFLNCRKGCVKHDAKAKTRYNVDENKDYTTVMNIQGKVLAKCVSTETIKHEIAIKSQLNSKYYCKVNRTDANTNTYYDDYCDDACKTLKEPLPSGVEIKHKPPHFPHADNTYVIAGALYELTCSKGYSYPANETDVSSGTQQLVCNGASHQYDDKKSKKQNSNVVACIKNRGCKKLPPAPAGVQYDTSSCKSDGDNFVVGCNITVTCETGYYPADGTYLSPGKQQLICGNDSQNFYDQFGNSIQTPLTCIKGCIQRNDDNDGSDTNAYYTTKQYNLPHDLKVICKGSQIKTDPHVQPTPDDHGFYCQTDNSNNGTFVTKSQCTNACVTLQTPNDSVLKSRPQRPPIEFNGVNYVQNGYEYKFECNNGKTLTYTCSGQQNLDSSGSNSPPQC